MNEKMLFKVNCVGHFHGATIPCIQSFFVQIDLSDHTIIYCF